MHTEPCRPRLLIWKYLADDWGCDTSTGKAVLVSACGVLAAILLGLALFYFRHG